MTSATGDPIEHAGQKEVWILNAASIPVHIVFEEARVRRPLLSTDRLLEQNNGVVLKAAGSYIELRDG